nr:MAG: hypothetical protein [Bacteriophage sp.]
MEATAVDELSYLRDFMCSDFYFNRTNSDFKPITPEAKLFFSYLYLNPVTVELTRPDDKGLDKLREVAMNTLNFSIDQYRDAYRNLVSLKMIRYKQTGIDEVTFLGSKDSSIVLSKQLPCDTFLASLPLNYIRYYLFINYHTDKEGGKLKKTIQQLADSSDFNTNEIVQMNNFFRDLGYFEISKDSKTGTNIYEVIK